MPKKTETINKFKTTKENVEYIKKLKAEAEFETPLSTIVEHLLNLGIKEHRKNNKSK